MTLDQRRKARAALYRYGFHMMRNNSADRAWQKAIEKTIDYYHGYDPVYEKLMDLRYFQRKKREETIQLLHIGSTTYQKHVLNLLSTVAVYAAQYGAFDEEEPEEKKGETHGDP